MEVKTKTPVKAERIKAGKKWVEVDVKTNLTPQFALKLSALLGEELMILSPQINS